MMSARLLSDKGHGKLYQASEKVFNYILKSYEVSLTWVLSHPAITLMIALGTLGLNVYLFVIIPKGFFPQQDTGRISGNIIGEQDTSFQAMKTRIIQLAKIVKADPGVQTVIGFSGGGAGTTTNTGRVFVSLKPLAARNNVTADQIINRLRPKLATVPGATLFLQATQDLRVGAVRAPRNTNTHCRTITSPI